MFLGETHVRLSSFVKMHNFTPFLKTTRRSFKRKGINRRMFADWAREQLELVYKFGENIYSDKTYFWVKGFVKS